MIWFVLVMLVILPFGGSLFYGAPYLPTRRSYAAAALDLLELRPGQILLDLGSGDGQIARLAAERGWRVIGHEINPWLVLVSRLRCRRYRSLVKIYWRSFWSVELPPCDGVFVFGIGWSMPRLAEKLTSELKSSTRVVSYAYELPGRKVLRRQGALFLYKF